VTIGRNRILMMKAAFVVAGCGLFLIAAPAWAHHSFTAEFDANQPVKLEGTITKWEMINPHSWIHLDVAGADGKVTSWMIEGGSPNALMRRGISKATLPPGTKIVVEGYRSKEPGTFRANGRDITFPDGRKLFVGSSGTGAPDERPEK
jgi:Family of unknown function (DUF6152)